MPPTTTTSTTAAAIGLTPAAGICGGTLDPVGTVTWTGLADNVPSPRCLVLQGWQHLRIDNRARVPIHAVLPHAFDTWIAHGDEFTTRTPIAHSLTVPGAYTLGLGPGSVLEGGVGIWFDPICAEPPNHGCVTPTTGP